MSLTREVDVKAYKFAAEVYRRCGGGQERAMMMMIRMAFNFLANVAKQTNLGGLARDLSAAVDGVGQLVGQIRSTQSATGGSQQNSPSQDGDDEGSDFPQPTRISVAKMRLVGEKLPLFSVYESQNPEGRSIFRVVHHVAEPHAITMLDYHDRAAALEVAKRVAGFQEDLALPSDRPLPERLELVARALYVHPHWAPVHLAAAMGFSRWLERQLVDGDVRLTAPSDDGALPLHLAVERGRLEVTKVLVAKGADVAKKDARLRTALHAAKTLEVLKELVATTGFREARDAEDEDGRRPVEVALRKGRPGCLELLLQAGASTSPAATANGTRFLDSLSKEVRITDDVCRSLHTLVLRAPDVLEQFNYQGRVWLHDVFDKRLLSSALGAVTSDSKRAALLAARDPQGLSPIAAAAMRNDLSIVCGLYSWGARVEEDEHALRIAAKAGNATILRALICFGAPVSALGNEFVATLPLPIKGIFEELRSASSDSKTPVTCVATEKGQRRALKNGEERRGAGWTAIALDGGGVRGLCEAHVLCTLERELKSIDESANITDSIDWLAGTSTGAILALALGRGKSPDDCRRIYLRLKDQVFGAGTGKPYSHEVLERLLQRELGGKDARMETIEKRVIVVAARADVCPAETVVFRSFASEKTPQDQRNPEIWKAARCSSAAPTYFSPVDGKYVDGGLVANNPTGELLVEMNDLLLTTSADGTLAERLHGGGILSLGTGKQPQKAVNPGKVAQSGGGGGSSSTTATTMIGRFVGRLEQVEALLALKDMLIEQIARADGSPVERSRAWCHSLGAAFFRFQPPLAKSIELDECDDARCVVDLLWASELYVRRETDAIRRAARVLHARWAAKRAGAQ